MSTPERPTLDPDHFPPTEGGEIPTVARELFNDDESSPKKARKEPETTGKRGRGRPPSKKKARPAPMETQFDLNEPMTPEEVGFIKGFAVGNRWPVEVSQPDMVASTISMLVSSHGGPVG